ncbi:MAG TPA: asparagine synthase-related protein [Candidatus Acidoferrales bacterium]|nr:asparagine synthase-related protein [Candidatus Acidoferrales bacterium]
MSGIVGMFRRDGGPIDRALLQSLTHFLAYVGPDTQQTWAEESIGFGHTLLRTTWESATECQPGNLEQRFWITADARLDCRTELEGKLKSAGQHVRTAGPDSELILGAYAAWGEACVQELRGDFAFAIWDASKRSLFCARDHFGIKPFYYADLGNLFLFSNTFSCLQRHPAVSDRLNDLAIADFLLFDTNQDAATTSFADIRRLPAAHSLRCEREAVSIRRYWTLSVTEPVRFRRESEYIEQFHTLLGQAVADRLRAKSAGILMSGGLDSTTVAATARRILAANGDDNGLFAETVVLDDLAPDDERHYATLTANALKIPIRFQTADDCRLFDGADTPEYRSPFPEHSAWPDQTPDLLRQIGARSRIALTGSGSDPGLSSRITAHFRQLLRKRHLARAVSDAVHYLSAEGRFSRLYLRARWQLLVDSKNAFDSYPKWLNEDLQREWRLQERWKAYGVPDRGRQLRNESNINAFRPEAVMSMMHVSWQDLFETLDPGATRVPVEVRHPFFDLRVVNFLLGLPRLPWCCDKELLRQSGRGILPEAVRLRRKSPVRHDPIVALLQKRESAWVDRFEPAPGLGRYVCRHRIPSVWRERSSGTAWVNLKPLSLNFWLRNNQR